MMGNLTWDPEWHYSSKYLEEGLQALQVKIEAEAQRHIREGRLRYTLTGETVDQANVKYSEAQNQAVEVKAIIMGNAISGNKPPWGWIWVLFCQVMWGVSILTFLMVLMLYR
ncbi:L-seryl-tRNA(Sec) kinase [Platysternon megacephalum]|uniref:L-seryl-tRNA(Sec) kinase n=1 Tax=Platysternon megacephalum TaxID=55544 RepID=A0A4D9EQY3_9SAUR|nr:L-seryl-tRNA(Sec) kinase [Platysternon megacephalum]